MGLRPVCEASGRSSVGFFGVMLLVYGPFFLIDFGIHNDYLVRDQMTYSGASNIDAIAPMKVFAVAHQIARR
jgi:hypothetical protein